MKTRQPIWQFEGNIGDASPLDFGGLFVYTDKTGVYEPECVSIERTTPDDVRGKDERWEVRRFIVEKCTFIDGILSDNRFHPGKPAWFASENDPRDNKLAALSSYIGATKDELAAMFTSPDVLERARAWSFVGQYFGFDNLDAYPREMTRKDLFNAYRAECFPHSVRRNKRAKCAAVAPSGEVGPFTIASV